MDRRRVSGSGQCPPRICPTTSRPWPIQKAVRVLWAFFRTFGTDPPAGLRWDILLCSIQGIPWGRDKPFCNRVLRLHEPPSRFGLMQDPLSKKQSNGSCQVQGIFPRPPYFSTAITRWVPWENSKPLGYARNGIPSPAGCL